MPLTDTDIKRLALAWQCFESEPKLNYEKFREVAGLSSVASARELMRVTKKKLKDEYGALSQAVAAAKQGTTASTDNTPTKKHTSNKSTATPTKKSTTAVRPTLTDNSGIVLTGGKKRGRPAAAGDGLLTGGGMMEGDDDDNSEHERVVKKGRTTPAAKKKVGKAGRNGGIKVEPADGGEGEGEGEGGGEDDTLAGFLVADAGVVGGPVGGDADVDVWY